MDDELLTTDEVAARLRATPRFVRRLVAERRITYVKVGCLVRFEEVAVIAYMDANRVTAEPRHNCASTCGGQPDGGPAAFRQPA